MRRRLQLDLSYAARAPWVPTRRQFERWIDAVWARRRDAAVVSIRVVGLAGSRSLNRRYRHKDWATNVLSFEGTGRRHDSVRRGQRWRGQRGRGQEWLLGELVLCAPVIAMEARLQGKRADAHWAHMTVHGVLHLLGFDHEVCAEAAKMESMEVQILDRLGFSDPYV